jgi:hypothetical protein
MGRVGPLQVLAVSVDVDAVHCLKQSTPSASMTSLSALCSWLQVLVAERGPLVFVFNWHPHQDYEGLKVAAPEPGKELLSGIFCELTV